MLWEEGSGRGGDHVLALSERGLLVRIGADYASS
jgi:hypothetical protein